MIKYCINVKNTKEPEKSVALFDESVLIRSMIACAKTLAEHYMYEVDDFESIIIENIKTRKTVWMYRKDDNVEYS